MPKRERNIMCGICRKIHLPSSLCDQQIISRKENVSNDKKLMDFILKLSEPTLSQCLDTMKKVKKKENSDYFFIALKHILIINGYQYDADTEKDIDRDLRKAVKIRAEKLIKKLFPGCEFTEEMQN